MAPRPARQPQPRTPAHRTAQSQPQRKPGPRTKFRTELSAGGIIFRRKAGSVEVFFIKDPYNRMTFPKGHQELGESLVETAVREIKEETGLEGLRYIAPVGRTLFRFRREGTTIEKTVYFFLFEAPSDAQEVLTGEGAIWEAQWVKVDKAFATSGYRNLDRLLSKALRIVFHEGKQSQKPVARGYADGQNRRRPRVIF
ncbi:MAG: NUDIX domain-containing protein [Candidatus Magasanikbacteria bacterium]|nr:NUDIX domain-containing protein [Candidatus Magasanikbacteria bacterium]MCA9388981.1 NUDIX domain-containing protein [Candidatus Magasanikbacteria bacterium]MCA9391004.1 NUDIX domain-containing protein [Candidatus Magasanikbacteria bacterium]USN52030.1 MAG: NUDIX domain-containing protein [Candidatus Nomurabacteria bacterium]